MDVINIPSIVFPAAELKGLYAAEKGNAVNPNLLSGTRTFVGQWTNSQYWERTNIYYKDCLVLRRSAKWSGVYKTIRAVAGNTYTFSVYVCGTKGNPCDLYPYVNGDTNIPGDLSKYHRFIMSGEWQRESLTIHCHRDGLLATRVELPEDGEVYIAAYKLELGSRATPWCEAAEDAANISLLNIDEWGTGCEVASESENSRLYLSDE